MTDTLKPNKKYGHLYAILRYETDVDPMAPIDLRVTVKKVVTDPHYAAREVERLNELNNAKGAYYFYQITRFEGVPVEIQDVAPLQSDAKEQSPGERQRENETSKVVATEPVAVAVRPRE